MRVPSVLWLFCFAFQLHAQKQIFEPRSELVRLNKAVTNPEVFGIYGRTLQKKINQSYVRPQLDLPGLVDDFGVHEYRPRCLEVRNKYAQSLIYWSKIIKKVRCVNCLIARGSTEVGQCIKEIQSLRDKVNEIYTSDLYEKNHILKFVWPLEEASAYTVKSIVIGNKEVKFKPKELEKDFIKVILKDDELKVQLTASDKEICLTEINILVNIIHKDGLRKSFVSSYAF